MTANETPDPTRWWSVFRNSVLSRRRRILPKVPGADEDEARANATILYGIEEKWEEWFEVKEYH